MALSHVVSEIFNVEKCRDLEIGTIRQMVYGFLLVFFSNFVHKT